MAAHRAGQGILQPVQAAYVVVVAVGYQDGRNLGAAQFGVIVHDLTGPGAVGLAGVDDDHLAVGVAHEVYLGASGVHGPKGLGVFVDVGAVYVLGNPHALPPAAARGLRLRPVAMVDGAGRRVNPSERLWYDSDTPRLQTKSRISCSPNKT